MIEGPATWRERAADWQADVKAEKRAEQAAKRGERGRAGGHAARSSSFVPTCFENYAGRFLSVEAKTRLATVLPQGGVYTGPTLVLAWNRGGATPVDSDPRTMNVNIDVDTTPDTYIEHRILVRIGDAGTTTPASPTMIRIGSSTGEAKNAAVEPWLDGGLPPMASTFQTGFHTRYMDPTEVYARFDELAEEFPNLAEMITLPNKTNGYQRRAQALMAGLTNPAGVGNLNATAATQAVILTARAWGHEGGNDLTAEFRNPNALNSPLTVSFTGDKDLVVNLATGPTGALTSTAVQVAQAINASPAFAKLVAQTYRGNAGGGIVQARPFGNLSDFLTTSTNANVQRGPFEYAVMRIRTKAGNNERVGVFLYCQQHAREWATPLTCLETAEQLLRNYGTDKTTRKLLDTLDIFILPSSNPDGAHYSMHNFNMQRKNMTNWCMFGGLETDDPTAANFWTGRPAPITGTPFVFNDSAARNALGTDMNRNNTVGTLFDGYIGASNNCSSEVYSGPSEASEPEIQNELWIADTFKNIKFSNNIHSFGGYFMWAPGTYLPDRGEGEAVHANIGVEKYFFEAGDRILNRIKDVRNTAILPERTGPIADVLYSAAGGNSADEHWYRRGVIAYSFFETGADRFGGVEYSTVSVASAAGATSVRSNNRNLFTPLEKVTHRPGSRHPGDADRPVGREPEHDESGAERHVHATAGVRARRERGDARRGSGADRGRVPAGLRHRGPLQGIEFAAGNYGLLESAYDYAKDETAPEVDDDRRTLVQQPDHDDVPVGQRAVRDPLHDGRVGSGVVVHGQAVGRDWAA